MPAEPLGVLLISGGHERAHYAFMVATAAAAMGRHVVVFATNEGCRGLSGAMTDDPHEAAVVATGVAGLQELRTASLELGVQLMACDSGMRMAGIDVNSLIPGVDVSGLPAFLSAVGAGQIVTL